MKRTVFAAFATYLLFGTLSIPAFAQETGGLLNKPLMVVADTAELKTGNDVVGRVGLADVVVATKENGDWLWVADAKGWIKRSAVVEANKAVDYFSGVISQNPTSEAYHRRATVWFASGNDKKGIEDLTTAIGLDGNNLRAINDRGNAYRRDEELEKSLTDFDTLLSKGGPHPVAYTNRALTHIARGDYEKAIADSTQAISRDEKFAPAYQARAAAKEAVADFAGAIQDLEKAIQVDPNFDLALNNLAWIYATAPDSRIRNGAKAVEYAQKASEMSGNENPGYLDTLAAAQAEAGNFSEAVTLAEKAASQAEEEPKRKEAIGMRLALYKEGKPYHRSVE